MSLSFSVHSEMLAECKVKRMNFSGSVRLISQNLQKSILDLSKHSRAQCYLCIHLSFHQGWLMWSLLTLVSHHHRRSASALCALVTGIMERSYNTYKLSWEPCKANGHKCTPSWPKSWWIKMKILSNNKVTG